MSKAEVTPKWKRYCSNCVRGNLEVCPKTGKAPEKWMYCGAWELNSEVVQHA